MRNRQIEKSLRDHLILQHVSTFERQNLGKLSSSRQRGWGKPRPSRTSGHADAAQSFTSRIIISINSRCLAQKQCPCLATLRSAKTRKRGEPLDKHERASPLTSKVSTIPVSRPSPILPNIAQPGGAVRSCQAVRVEQQVEPDLQFYWWTRRLVVSPAGVPSHVNILGFRLPAQTRACP